MHRNEVVGVIRKDEKSTETTAVSLQRRPENFALQLSTRSLMGIPAISLNSLLESAESGVLTTRPPLLANFIVETEEKGWSHNPVTLATLHSHILDGMDPDPLPNLTLLIKKGSVEGLKLFRQLGDKSSTECLIQFSITDVQVNDQNTEYQVKRKLPLSDVMYAVICNQTKMIMPLMETGSDITRVMVDEKKSGNKTETIKYNFFDILTGIDDVNFVRELLRVIKNKKISVERFRPENDFIDKIFSASNSQKKNLKNRAQVILLLDVYEYAQQTGKNHELQAILFSGELSPENITCLDELLSDNSNWQVARRHVNSYNRDAKQQSALTAATTHMSQVVSRMAPASSATTAAAATASVSVKSREVTLETLGKAQSTTVSADSKRVTRVKETIAKVTVKETRVISELSLAEAKEHVYALFQESSPNDLKSFFNASPVYFSLIPKGYVPHDAPHLKISFLCVLAIAYDKGQWTEEAALSFGNFLMGSHSVAPRFSDDYQYLIKNNLLKGLQLFNKLTRSIYGQSKLLRLRIDNPQSDSLGVTRFILVSRVMYGLMLHCEHAMLAELIKDYDLEGEVVANRFFDNTTNQYVDVQFACMDFLTELGKINIIQAFLAKHRVTNVIKRFKGNEAFIASLIHLAGKKVPPRNEDDRPAAIALMDAYEAIKEENQAKLLFALRNLFGNDLLFLAELFSDFPCWKNLFASLDDENKRKITNILDEERSIYRYPSVADNKNTSDDAQLDFYLEHGKKPRVFFNSYRTEAALKLKEMQKTSVGQSVIQQRMQRAFAESDPFFITLLCKITSPFFFNREMMKQFRQPNYRELRKAVLQEVDEGWLIYEMIVCSAEADQEELMEFIKHTGKTSIQLDSWPHPRSFFSALATAYQQGNWNQENATRFVIRLLISYKLSISSGDYFFLIEKGYLASLQMLLSVFGPQKELGGIIHVHKEMPFSCLMYALLLGHGVAMISVLCKLGFDITQTLTYTIKKVDHSVGDEKDNQVISYNFLDIAILLGREEEIRSTLKASVASKKVLTRNKLQQDLILSLLREKMPTYLASRNEAACQQASLLVSAYEYILEEDQAGLLAIFGKLSAANKTFLNEIFAENAFWKKVQELSRANLSNSAVLSNRDAKGVAVTVVSVNKIDEKKAETFESLLQQYKDGLYNANTARNDLLRLMVEKSIQPTATTYRTLIDTQNVRGLELLSEVTGKMTARREQELLFIYSYDEQYGDDPTKPFIARQSVQIPFCMYAAIRGHFTMVPDLCKHGFELSKTMDFCSVGKERGLQSITFPSYTQSKYTFWEMVLHFSDRIETIRELIRVAISNKVTIPHIYVFDNDSFIKFIREQLRINQSSFTLDKSQANRLIDACHAVQTKDQTDLIRQLSNLDESNIQFLNSIFSDDPTWKAAFAAHNMLKTPSAVVSSSDAKETVKSKVATTSVTSLSSSSAAASSAFNKGPTLFTADPRSSATASTAAAASASAGLRPDGRTG